MANTFTQIHIQVVIAVKFRQALIAPSWRNNLFKYITTIIQDHGHKVLAIGGIEDHVHIFIGFRPNESLSTLMMVIKRETAEWINKEHFTKTPFRWQKGFGAFSYSMSHIKPVINYILNQERHHTQKKFIEEYEEFLTKFRVEYDKRYIFTTPENNDCPQT